MATKTKRVATHNSTSCPNRDLENPTMDTVGHLHPEGSLGHGVLSALAVEDLTTTEIYDFFRSLSGSSLLTYLRRQGLIAKGDPHDTRSKWYLTDLGLRLLTERSEYTLADYQQYRGPYRPCDELPWRIPREEREPPQKSLQKGC